MNKLINEESLAEAARIIKQYVDENSGGDIDLENYYTKTETDTKIAEKRSLVYEREAGENAVVVTSFDTQFNNMDYENGKEVRAQISTTAINANIRDMGSPEEPSEKTVDIEANVSYDAHFYADVFDMAKNSSSRVHVAADRAHLMSGNSDFKVTPTQTILTTPEFLLNGNQVATVNSYSDITASNWVESAEYSDYPYAVDLLTDKSITANDFAEVVFDVAEATSGNYAPVAKTGDFGVRIYAKVNTEITIPQIIIIGGA